MAKGFSWTKQRSEENNRYQVSIHHPQAPTRVFKTLAKAKSYISKAKKTRYKGSAYDLYDRETGEFLQSGNLGSESNPGSVLKKLRKGIKGTVKLSRGRLIIKT